MSESQTEEKKNTPLTDLAVHVVSILLAITFVGAALFKLITWESTVEQFERFGYDPWFIWVTVLVELVGAVLIVMSEPHVKSWGTTVITTTMVAAMLSHLKAGEPGEMIPPLVVMLMAMFVAWYGPMKPSDEEIARQERQRKAQGQGTVQNTAVYYATVTMMIVSGYFGVVYIMGSGPFVHDGSLRFVVAGIFFAIAVICYSMSAPKPAYDRDAEAKKKHAPSR